VVDKVAATNDVSSFHTLIYYSYILLEFQV
jgi:hypothetical protein